MLVTAVSHGVSHKNGDAKRQARTQNQQTIEMTAFVHVGVWRSLVSRLVRDQEASGSNPDTPTMRSVLIGSEYPIKDTPLFYAQNMYHAICAGV